MAKNNSKNDVKKKLHTLKSTIKDLKHCLANKQVPMDIANNVCNNDMPKNDARPKWMVYSAEIILGNDLDNIAIKYNDTRKNILDHFNHSLKQNAPLLYEHIHNRIEFRKKNKE